ncbi:bud site selection protein 20 [Metschnikowia bicuspidata]|uniref:Bud site selection protein 20 n=1 Tax=Metschnikowia bicuspidata TaxID=27322 RepID=A0A4P9ZDS4_9ASCO|nr:bud site selection protein 20 [Metschnikowia bicuspidata]
MGRYSVKRYKTKRREKDVDLIYNDISSKESIARLENQPLDDTKPGLGQYYCVECAKYFEFQLTLDIHRKGKVHKRRVKELRQRPYSPLESQAAAGYNVQRFLESVEKYKKLEAQKKENQAEFDALILQRKGTLDAIITGILSGTLEPSAPAEEDQIVDA